jgi:hypothetical protein
MKLTGRKPGGRSISFERAKTLNCHKLGLVTTGLR